MITIGQNNIFKPKQILNLSATTPSSNESFEPTTVSQALKIPHWRQTMSEEFDALVHNSTWTRVPHNPTQNIVGCKWIFHIKRNPDGSIMRYKARLVAKDFHQRLEIDFSDTFSLVVKLTTIQILLHLAVTYGWALRQLDVNNAFLQGTLVEDVFMQQPQGFHDPQFPQHVCKLQKAIYGLHQAPRTWYTELQNLFLSIGFIISKFDNSLFIRRQKKFTMFLLVHVDDIIITGTSSQQVQQFITTLAHRFSLKDLGPLAYFLGVEAIHTSYDLFLSQYKYIRDLLEKHNCRPSILSL